MKTIKLRGKGIDNGEWIYGLPTIRHDNKCFIQEIGSGYGQDGVEIDIKTLGQFTGLQDSKGKDIYEGNIVQYKKSEQGKQESFYLCTHEVVFYKGSFGFQEWYTDGNDNLKNRLIHHPGHLTIPDIYEIEFDIEIIGNIHENPELLNQQS